MLDIKDTPQINENAVQPITHHDIPAVVIEHLSKTYPPKLVKLKQLFRRPVTPPVEALRDVSFDIKQGEIFGLIGRNGAGKTTLTKIIATLVQPTRGSVTVLGCDSVGDETRVRAAVGLATAEERSFYWRLTIEQNLLFFARLYGMTTRDARTRIDELFERFDLTQYARRRFGELSTGNKQRMAVARALLSRPPVMLLDEPTRSLDPLAAASMRGVIRSLAQDTPPATVLLTSHNLAEVEELCQRVGVISGGQIQVVDTPANLRAQNSEHAQVTLTVREVSTAHVKTMLTANTLDHYDDAKFDIAATVADDAHHTPQTLITFTMSAETKTLDKVIRRIQTAGGRIVACHTERATLLDVLEAYEK